MLITAAGNTIPTERITILILRNKTIYRLCLVSYLSQVGVDVEYDVEDDIGVHPVGVYGGQVHLR